MPLELVNSTPFTADRYALTARNGATFLRIVLKGAFDVLDNGQVKPAEVQPAIVMEDEYWGAPGKSAVKYESELLLYKPATDLVVVGDACAPGDRPVTRMMVGLSYQGRRLKQFQVSGDREWRRGLLGWSPSAPKYFTRIPVTYDRAYGGTDDEGSEPRNRSGMGYSTRASNMEGLPVPNIEWANDLSDSPSKRPAPAGFGVIARNWMPRMKYAGTYDDQWLETQFPLLPADFDDRFFHSVAADQWIDPPRGGEEIVIDGMSPRGQIRFALPSCAASVSLSYTSGQTQSMMRTETVLVDTLRRTCTVTWSADADIHGDPFRLERITIGDPSGAKPCGCGG